MESILTSVKKLLGYTKEQTDFDTDIIIHINSALARLNLLGVGPKDGFSIQDDIPIWEDFIEDNPKLNDVKTYVYLKVKLVFDPPSSASVVAAMERSIQELEFCLNVTAESI